MKSKSPAGPEATFGFQLVLTTRAWRRALDEALATYGLSEATWRPLIHLRHLGDGIRQHELAASLGIEGPSLVRLLDSLQAGDLIERREDGTDRRAKTLHLTDGGRALAESIGAVATEVHRQLLKGIPRGEIEACQRAFARIERNMAGLSRPPAGK